MGRGALKRSWRGAARAAGSFALASLAAVACSYSFDLPDSTLDAGGSGDASADGAIPNAADLRFDMAASPLGEVPADASLVVRWRIRNAGPAAAAHVVATLGQPQATYQVTVPAGWSCNQPDVDASVPLVCEAASVAVGSSSTIVADGVTTKFTRSTVLTGSVTSDTPDPNPQDNTATARASLP